MKWWHDIRKRLEQSQRDLQAAGISETERREQDRRVYLHARVAENERLRAQDIPEWKKPPPCNSILHNGFPPTFIAWHASQPGERDPTVAIFDPALKQFGRAFRNGDPHFGNLELEAAWRGARRVAMQHALAVVVKHTDAALTLRGSRVLQAWFGEQAREPGDLDFVAPLEWRIDEEGQQLATDLTSLFQGSAREIAPGLAFTGHIRFATLWTYERVPGYRLVVPWHADGIPDGWVQLDVVFGEKLLDDSVVVDIEEPASTSSCVQVRCASRALSLAWKLLWLCNDLWPQGKDLYDAILLAETSPLDLVLLGRVMDAASHAPLGEQLTPAAAAQLGQDTVTEILQKMDRVEWTTLTEEMIARSETLGTKQLWIARLNAALTV